MKIHLKFICIMIVAVALSAVTNILVLRAAVYPTFVRMEHDKAIRHAERAINAIRTEIASLALTVADYADWDDAYEYVISGNATFIERNFTPSSVKNLGVNIIYIEGTGGQARYERVFDDSGNEVSSASALLLQIDQGHILTPSDSTTEPISGLMASPRGPLLMVSRPIRKTTGDGKAVGRLVMGRLLDDNLISTLRVRSDVDIGISVVDRDTPHGVVAVTLDTHILEPNILIGGDGTRLTVLCVIKSLLGMPFLEVSIAIPRDITQLGMTTLTYAAMGIALSGLVVVGVLAAVLQWMLIGPLVDLTSKVVRIGSHGVAGRGLELDRSDELGILSREFQRALETLAEVRKQLLMDAHQTGIALMASGVLHNLRNQLAPLTLRLSSLCESFSSTAPERVGQALDKILTGNLPPIIRDKAAEFVRLAVRDLHSRYIQMRVELGFAMWEADRIEKVLSELDAFSRATGTAERISLIGPVRDAVSLLPAFPGLDVKIELAASLETCPPIVTSGFVLEHIVYNLLLNAIEAVVAAGKTIDTIEISAELKEFEEVEMRQCVDLQITDHGIGIEPDSICLVFTNGYSTKGGCRRGVGLHWCSNTIAAVGGRIFAESPGPGLGTTLHILLPLSAQPSVVATT